MKLSKFFIITAFLLHFCATEAAWRGKPIFPIARMVAYECKESVKISIKEKGVGYRVKFLSFLVGIMAGINSVDNDMKGISAR